MFSHELASRRRTNYLGAYTEVSDDAAKGKVKLTGRVKFPRKNSWLRSALFLIVLIGFFLFLLYSRRRRAENVAVLLARVDQALASRDAVDWPPSHLLEELLPNKEGGNKELVVAAANCDYVEFAENFAESLLRLNISNFVLVPLDSVAQRTLADAYPGHVLPLMPGLRERPLYVERIGKKSFKDLTATRPAFLKPFLKKGYSVFYNDIDMVWTRNAWDELDGEGKDFAPTRLWNDGPTGLCSCMMYLQPTPLNLELMSRWQAEIITGKHPHDQPAFKSAAAGMDLLRSGESSNGDGVAVVTDTDKFPHGRKYFGLEDGFKQPAVDKDEINYDRDKAVIVHNNWVLGKEAKVERFKKHGLWKLSGRIGRYRCHTWR